MDLLEYQAKQLFHQVGIPVLPSQPIFDPREMKKLQIPYPVVLKSQVRAGGRGKAGGVRFVENTIDAIAAARIIFKLPIVGEIPQVLLAEARYNCDREFFLAVVLDYQLKKPVLLGSAHGGVNVESLLNHLHKVVVEDEFSPFYARRLAIKMGVKGSLIQAVSAIIAKIYDLFITYDLDMVEINPLGVNAAGEVMALDGKITANDYALNRHPQLLDIIYPPQVEEDLEEETSDPEVGIQFWKNEQTPGNVAIISNCPDLAIATWENLILQKVQPFGCWLMELPPEISDPQDSSEGTTGQWLHQWELLWESCIQTPNLKAILINLAAVEPQTPWIIQALQKTFGHRPPSEIQEALSERPTRQQPSHRPSRRRAAPPKLILRVSHGQFSQFQEQLGTLTCAVESDFALALGRVVKAVAK